jgi:hypothetical protein
VWRGHRSGGERRAQRAGLDLRRHLKTVLRNSPIHVGLYSCVEEMECWQREHAERYKLRFIERDLKVFISVKIDADQSLFCFGGDCISLVGISLLLCTSKSLL